MRGSDRDGCRIRNPDNRHPITATMGGEARLSRDRTPESMVPMVSDLASANLERSPASSWREARGCGMRPLSSRERGYRSPSPPKGLSRMDPRPVAVRRRNAGTGDMRGDASPSWCDMACTGTQDRSWILGRIESACSHGMEIRPHPATIGMAGILKGIGPRGSPLQESSAGVRGRCGRGANPFRNSSDPIEPAWTGSVGIPENTLGRRSSCPVEWSGLARAIRSRTGI